jgi:hypothetical protein
MKFSCKLTTETLTCNELQVKDYKNLLKSIYGETPDENLFIETLCDIFSSVSNKPSDYFKKLTVIDFFCLLLDIRANSLGNICNVTLNHNNTKSNLELKLSRLKEDILNKTILQETVEHENIKIELGCPLIEDINQDISNDCRFYIKNVCLLHLSKQVNCPPLTYDQMDKLFDKISAKTYSQINKKCKAIHDSIVTLNFLERYKVKNVNVNFDFSIDYIIWFAKLIFNESLESLFDNIYYLSYLGHMSASYIENAPVGEYNYFVGLLRKSLSSNSDSQTNGQLISTE